MRAAFRFFGLFILKLVLIILIITIFLDLIYTYSFSKISGISKFEYIKSQKNKKFDYIFLGSSRVENHINIKALDSVLNRNCINFGISDSKPKDILTVLKLIEFYNIKYDSIFIQTDYYYNSTEKSNFLYVEMLPFIRDNEVIRSYYDNESDYLALCYFPFYRYCKSDSKLGFRTILSCFNKKSRFNDSKGFLPLFGSRNNWQRSLPIKLNSKNPYNKEILLSLKRTKSNYVFYVAPFRNDTKNMNFISLLKNQYPVLWDFSKSIEDPDKFKNGYHLNELGSKEFSIQLANKIKS